MGDNVDIAKEAIEKFSWKNYKEYYMFQACCQLGNYGKLFNYLLSLNQYIGNPPQYICWKDFKTLKYLSEIQVASITNINLSYRELLYFMAIGGDPSKLSFPVKIINLIEDVYDFMKNKVLIKEFILLILEYSYVH